MKKILIIALLMVSAKVFAQSYPITGINILLPASPDAVVAKWVSGAAFAIEAVSQPANGRINPDVEESRILVIIKKDGTKICGDYTAGTAPQARFNQAKMVWSGSSAASVFGRGCTLYPGDYTLSVQFFGNVNGKMVALSDEKIKPFNIRGNDQLVVRGNVQLGAEKLQKKTESDAALYYPLSATYPAEVVDVGDTLYMRVENTEVSAPGRITYTIKNTSTNKTSQPSVVKIMPRQGVIRIALPLQNSIVANGQTGVLTLSVYKKYYYISFKRN